MRLIFKILFVTLTVMLVFTACKKDDEDPPPPPRDRGEEAQRSQEDIENFLSTHFYNYEDFQNPPSNFDYKIVIDTISEANSGKTPLIEQVSYKMVTDRVEPNVTYKMYYLDAIQGEGDPLSFADYAVLSYHGLLLNRNTFDMSNIPVQFDMTGVIPGFQEGLVEFNGASSFIKNEDGTITFENFGVGAIFIPTGMGYFNNPPINSGIGMYRDLVFTFQLYAVITDIDHDNDGIPSKMEDLNENGILVDDDTDGDGIPNFLDDDDDGDGVLTRDEIIVLEDGTIEFTDSNGNGTPDYLDPTYPFD